MGRKILPKRVVLCSFIYFDAIIVRAFDKENSVNLIIPEEANAYVTKEAFLDDGFTH